MVRCIKCDESLFEEDLIKCINCTRELHFSCGGVSEQYFRKMGKTRRENWKCIDCKNKKPDNEEDEDNNVNENVMFFKLKKIIEDMSKGINSKLNDFEDSLQYSSNQMDSLLNGFKEMKITFGLLQSKQEALEKENLAIKKTVKELKSQIQTMEQKSLERNLEILGVPESIEESQLIPKLCKKININCPDSGDYYVKRAFLGVKDKPKPIIVSFKSKLLRDNVLKESKKYKPRVSDFTGLNTDTSAVYVNEHLIPPVKKLFLSASKMKKEKGYSFLWVSEGKILLRKTPTSKVQRLYDLDDIQS